MMRERYEIGGKSIEITTLYEDTHRLCAGYQTDKSPDFFVQIESSDIAYERKKSALEDEKEGRRIVAYSEGYLETLAVYRKIAEQMLEYDTILFHGSCIAVDGEAYLFTAKSGTGKSTHTRLWRETFGQRAVMVNDDKPLIYITKQGAIVYGTPWRGKHFLGENIRVPLKGICILERGDVNKIRSITKSEAFPMFLQQTFRPSNVQKMTMVLELLNQFGNQVPAYRLSCNMNPEAARISYEKMKGASGIE